MSTKNKTLLGAPTFVRAPLVTLVLLAVWTTGPAYGVPGCWRLSEPSGGAPLCSAGETCVEWEMGSTQIAYECCILANPDRLPCGGCLAGVSPRDESFTGLTPVMESLLPTLGPAGKSRRAISHPVPKLPVMVDGTLIAPETLPRFDGQPLHFLMSRGTLAQSALFAFTTWDALFEALRTQPLRQPSLIVREAPAMAASGVVLYEEEAWAGASYFLPSGQALDLTATWWNKRIASLRGVGTGTVVTLFENADLSGSSLTLATDLGWPDLSAFGWTKRASTVVVWPAGKTSEP